MEEIKWQKQIKKLVWVLMECCSLDPFTQIDTFQKERKTKQEGITKMKSNLNKLYNYKSLSKPTPETTAIIEKENKSCRLETHIYSIFLYNPAKEQYSLEMINNNIVIDKLEKICANSFSFEKTAVIGMIGCR